MAARAKKSKLRDARLQLGLSQAEVGERLGVSGAAIGHYETGVSSPSADRAAQLSKLLGLKPGDIAVCVRGSAEVTAASSIDDARRGAGRVHDAGCRAEAKSRCSMHSGHAGRGAPGGDEADPGLREHGSRVAAGAGASPACVAVIVGDIRRQASRVMRFIVVRRRRSGRPRLPGGRGSRGMTTICCVKAQTFRISGAAASAGRLVTVAMSPLLHPDRCRSAAIASGVLILGEMAHAPKAGPAAAVESARVASGSRTMRIVVSRID